MKVRTIVLLFLVFVVAVPIQAQSNFVADFIRHVRPSEEAAPPLAPPSAMSQFLLNGEIPITLNDIVNMMLDQNLDIQTNRLTPRSSALQTLVFYKVLQPSLSFTGSVTRNTSSS